MSVSVKNLKHFQEDFQTISVHCNCSFILDNYYVTKKYC